MSEEETKELSKEQLKMQELCLSMTDLLKQKEQVRIGLIRNDMVIADLNSIIMARIEDIEELERKGIKRYKVEEVKPDQKVQDPQKPGVDKHG